MAESDEKKINYESFQSAISKLLELKIQLDDKKSKLAEANSILTDEENWKGASRNYYCDIATDQEKKFNEINEALGDFITDLSDTLSNFDNLDRHAAKNFGRQGE